MKTRIYTKTTGLLVGNINPNDHIEKENQLLAGIQKRFNANDLNPIDKNIASAMMSDIQDAIGYIPQ